MGSHAPTASITEWAPSGDIRATITRIDENTAAFLPLSAYDIADLNTLTDRVRVRGNPCNDHHMPLSDDDLQAQRAVITKKGTSPVTGRLRQSHAVSPGGQAPSLQAATPQIPAAALAASAEPAGKHDCQRHRAARACACG